MHCDVTVMILSFWTDRSGQTVQTQIRLLLEEQSDQGLHCLPFCLHLLDILLYGKPACSNVWMITAFFSGVRMFRNFTLIYFDIVNIAADLEKKTTYCCIIQTLFILQAMLNTVMILSFRTDMPGQTVQTQIRLLLEKQSDQGLHCLPFCLHHLDSLL